MSSEEVVKERCRFTKDNATASGFADFLTVKN